ncbi:MAG: hydroxyacylglutathione hydrolase [Turicibacter sp.]|nr:hydroxyacylglutathione hydrolase [Turicibacter sp.]
MQAEIKIIPCLNDNYAYLIHDPKTGACSVVDAPEAAPIIQALADNGWTLSDILITHHHHDHVGGVRELKDKFGCRVVAPHDKLAPIHDVDLRVEEGDIVAVGSIQARVLHTPGHTLDHISYVFDGESAIFSGDTLFSGGCGRVFEGTYPMMWESLLKLRAQPDDYHLYFGHEYTASNVSFCLGIDAGNPLALKRQLEVTKLRSGNQPTVPVLLGTEKQVNIFLRADQPAIAECLGLEGAQPVEVFGKLRELRNSF